MVLLSHFGDRVVPLILYSYRLGDITKSGCTPVWCGVDDLERGCHGSPQSLQKNDGLSKPTTVFSTTVI